MNGRTNHDRADIRRPGWTVTGEWSLAPGEEPPLAAHLVTPRGLYTHHGVYVGHGRVIHYAGLGRGLRRGPVEDVSLERFARGRGIRVRSGTVRRFDREQVVERARTRLGERRYRVFTNNCEHFCEWCLGGHSRSAQVDSWRIRLRGALNIARNAVSTLQRGLAETRSDADRCFS